MVALDKTRQDRIGSLYRLQAQNETSWGQIDAVLKTTDDVKMLEVILNFRLMNHKAVFRKVN